MDEADKVTPHPVEVDNADNTGVEAVRTRVAELAAEFEFVGMKWNQRWLAARQSRG